MCSRVVTGERAAVFFWSIRPDFPQQFGDEPLLIARKPERPVIVGEDRSWLAGFAEHRFGPQFHLLDDGFQHRALARDFESSCSRREDATELLPAGRLREPLASLQRADAVVLTRGASPESFPVEGKLVWRVRRGIAPKATPTPGCHSAGSRGRKTSVAIAQGRIRNCGRSHLPRSSCVFQKTSASCSDLKRQTEAGGFVTTEKDAINLGDLLPR